MAEVEKVTSARDRSSIRVYMKSTRLIHKQNIYDLERGIKDQLFPDKQITIKIQEKYRLSGQYTPEKLLKIKALQHRRIQYVPQSPDRL